MTEQEQKILRTFVIRVNDDIEMERENSQLRIVGHIKANIGSRGEKLFLDVDFGESQFRDIELSYDIDLIMDSWERFEKEVFSMKQQIKEKTVDFIYG